MNNQLIKKIIATSNDSCPEFVYQNPLLDKNVTNALSKSFMKILNISNQNSSTNNNLRLSILENIRKACTVEPEGHSKVDDDFTELLAEIYKINISESSSSGEKSLEKRLDAFLVRKLKHMDINSRSQGTLNPEVVQALINLNENGVYLDVLSKDVIHWNVGLNQYLNVLKNLWDTSGNTSSELTDDICIKIKPQIEMLLLNVCSKILTGDQSIDDILQTDSDLEDLIKMCSISTQCFQMCSGILNFLFIMTNFAPEMQKFIPDFVKRVKVLCPPEATCSLYPYQLSSLVILLDFEIDELPEPLKSKYIEPTVKHLRELHKKSENDVILLLSHFPQWFDIYFSNPTP